MSYGQSEIDAPSLLLFRDGELQRLKEVIVRDGSVTSQMALWKLDFYQNFDSNSVNFTNPSEEVTIQNDITPPIGQFLYYLNMGDYYFYKYDNQLVEAQQQYLQALSIAERQQDVILECFALRKILELYRSDYLLGNVTAKQYLERYERIAFDEVERNYALYFKLILNFQYYDDSSWDVVEANRLLRFAETSNSYLLNAIIFQLISSYESFLNNNKKAIIYENKALTNLNKLEGSYNHTLIKRSLLAKARYFLEVNNDSVGEILTKINPINKNRLEESYAKYVYLYNSISDSLKSNYKGAYQNIVKYNVQLEEERFSKNENKFKELETKYQTAEKEKENLLLQAQKNRNRNLAIGLAGFLVLGAVLSLLIYRNTKRKQLIAEQEKQLQIQKTTTLLKEQEINTINAMVAGQEKERLRLARDLHDNLGGTLAAIKMHIGNLQVNLDKTENPQDLLEKANELISAAYRDVRSIAHERNSGVIAKEGLLPAIQKLARTVTVANRFEVIVQEYGLNERLSNNLEITIFRIVQELITNIIKHAEATEASVSLTQHENELNIIVEDNGKGFKVGKLSKVEGMGLGSIERRIEYLDGTMEVDSTINKGTSIIIDIPI